MKMFNGTPCMPWPGATSSKGYARLRIDGKWASVHRAIYSNRNGPVPSGYFLDHLCRNRSCVNPDHLEVVTPEENTMRGESFSAINAKKTQCMNGHELSGENLKIRIRNGRKRRVCRVCRRNQLKKDRSRER